MSNRNDESLVVLEPEIQTESGSVVRAILAPNRRRFLFGAAAAAAGALGTMGLAGCAGNPNALGNNPGDQPSPPQAPSVTDVLNFALNLEYLEASFYGYAANGTGIPSSSQGASPGTVTGGAKVAFSDPQVAAIAAQLAAEELDHVNFLRATITAVGGTPVSMPAIDLTAGGTYTVNSDATFLSLARELEDTGMSAYIGAAQYLVSSAQALTYAAQIAMVEGQHEGNLRSLCIQKGITSKAVDTQDIPPTGTSWFNTSPTTGLSPLRTTSQVLAIVYGSTSGATASGGFFPKGLNGTIGVE